MWLFGPVRNHISAMSKVKVEQVEERTHSTPNWVWGLVSLLVGWVGCVVEVWVAGGWELVVPIDQLELVTDKGCCVSVGSLTSPVLVSGLSSLLSLVGGFIISLLLFFLLDGTFTVLLREDMKAVVCGVFGAE